jgi:hypothetical protein
VNKIEIQRDDAGRRAGDYSERQKAEFAGGGSIGNTAGALRRTKSEKAFAGEIEGPAAFLTISFGTGLLTLIALRRLFHKLTGWRNLSELGDDYAAA